MRKFLNLLVKSNVSQEEIKKIEKRISFLPYPDTIEVFNQKLNLREIVHTRWEKFKSLDDYFQWRNKNFELFKKNRLSVKELSDQHEESIKQMNHQICMMFHYYAIKKQSVC